MSIKENDVKLERLLNLGFGTEVENILSDACPFCGTPVTENDFDDDLSRREFEVSGMCQECQDKMFGGNDVDE